MDNALLALSLKDDDDAPFNLPDFPQFYATERNACSLIGRLLNPRFQNMANLILDMPRKWQKVNRVRGIALTKERFQFIFSHANDLQDVLDKGMQTHNDWGLAIERWVETPPPGYLQSVSIWVRISNIPVNHYTKPAITELGELIGHVEVVAFDPEKSQRQDYVRVKINIEVTKPLKKSRVLNLPGGGQTTIYYFYEKVQKRCTECQRLTHAKEHCPLLAYKQNMRAVEATKNRLSPSTSNHTFLSEGDPLFGVLHEDQVGINPLSGRPRIAPEILQEMRNYLLASSKEERHVREQRVIFSVKEAEKNPITQKAMLQLIPPPIFTTNLDKGKGIVFDFEKASSEPETNSQPQKLMASAISAGQLLNNPINNVFCRLSLPPVLMPSTQISNLSFSGGSNISIPTEKPKRKSGRYKRIPKTPKKMTKATDETMASTSEVVIPSKKRKAENDLFGSFRTDKKNAQNSPQDGLLKNKEGFQLVVASKAAKGNASEMVPHEGPSKP
ncbi:uncharacterized protein LOC103862173 [Brassica rapa]|uniref:uncharacterized protein LOC103862173 n=1 Tax=Brassica campestris TaxID=3711 RepID=UPI0004F17817|nr:uncharacterized protein LOC103862173 [Brassica rapa]